MIDVLLVDEIVSRAFYPLNQAPFAPRELQDPFGLRRAVVPVFFGADDASLIGMGTAFHLDHWGQMITADHVIDQMRPMSRTLATGKLADVEVKLSPGDTQAFVLLGHGVVFGRVPITPQMMPHVKSVHSIIRQKDDPLAALRGEIGVEIAADVSLIRIDQPSRDSVATLPIRLRGWRPRRGEWVYAVGFPELNCKPLDANGVERLISEGMFGAYGQIVDAFPRGRDRSNPTPVIEVRANWPSGMSGGPVINAAGEVVGLVSRSLLAAEGEEVGTGYFAPLQLIPQLHPLLSTLDFENPHWRRGWILLDQDQRLLEAFPSLAAARAANPNLTEGTVLRQGAVKLGTDGYMTY